MAPSVGDGSFLRVPHPVFDFGEGLLDWVKIGRVRRQVPKPCAGGTDDAAERSRLVTAEIVHDDDVAGPEHGNQLLLDIGSKAFAVDRSIEDRMGL